MTWVKPVETWAIQQEQQRHKEALQYYGELAVVRVIWTIEDFYAGLVTRCSVCQATGANTLGITSLTQQAANQQRLSQVYKDSSDVYCSSCYGVGFTGGFQPTIYRMWFLANDNVEHWDKSRFGEMRPNRPRAEFEASPPLKQNTLVIRVLSWTDSTMTIPQIEDRRYVLGTVNPLSLRTGALNPSSTTYVGQSAPLINLSQQHPFNNVPNH